MISRAILFVTLTTIGLPTLIITDPMGQFVAYRFEQEHPK